MILEAKRVAALQFSPGINLSIGESTNEKISAEHNVQNASHQKFNQLRGIDYFPAKSFTKHFLRHLVVAVTNLKKQVLRFEHLLFYNKATLKVLESILQSLKRRGYNGIKGFSGTRSNFSNKAIYLEPLTLCQK